MISIIIPTYNRSHYLKEVLSSYIKQWSVGEIIIVDDKSEDNTAEVVRAFQGRYSQIKLIQHKKNKGLPASRNTGVKNSVGKYILFGEDDVLFLENYSQILLKHLLKNRADIIAGRLIPLKGNESLKTALGNADLCQKPLINYRNFRGNFQVKTEKDKIVPFLHACALIKKEVFDHLNYDEKSFKGTYTREETDFYLRALDKGFKIIFCPHAFIFHLPKQKLKYKSGCRPSSKGKAQIWYQINNFIFLRKNRFILKKKLNIDYKKVFLYSIWLSFFKRLATFFLKK